ncbi:beta strand repeat-containing protein [Leptospira ognonensis]|nr:DUF1565 domain-containing protein [Leptospira ognonensis]
MKTITNSLLFLLVLFQILSCQKSKSNDSSSFLLPLLFSSAISSSSSSSTGSTTTADTTFYVSTSGNDSNAGTATSPLLTISQALSKSGATRVNVAGGTYSISSALLVTTVSLYGGYSSDFSSRSITSNVTRITTSSYPGIYLSGTATVDGFTITAASTTSTAAAVTITSGSPTVSNNTLTGRNGILISGSNFGTVTISNNTITGGSASISDGIYLLSFTAGATLQLNNNTISGSSGTPTYSYGLEISSLIDGTASSRITINIKGGTIDGRNSSSNSFGIYGYLFSYVDLNITDSATIKTGTSSDSTSTAAAVYLTNSTNSTVTVTNSTLLGGSGGSSSTTYGASGIYWNNSSPSTNTLTATGNTIYGGSGGAGVYGMATIAGNMTATGNTIFAGGNSSTSLSKGIVDSSTGTVLVNNNIIYGGNGTQAIGINPNSSIVAKLYNNTIVAGTRAAQTTVEGILVGGSATPDIQNNIIYVTDVSATKYCIAELSTGSDPLVIKNNTLFGCTTNSYYNEGTTPVTTVGNMEALNGNYTGNIILNPTFTDVDGTDDDITTYSDNDLTLGVTVGNDVRYGGRDLSATFTTDKAGTTRTTTPDTASNTGHAGWSMGALEKD